MGYSTFFYLVSGTINLKAVILSEAKILTILLSRFFGTTYVPQNDNGDCHTKMRDQHTVLIQII